MASPTSAPAPAAPAAAAPPPPSSCGDDDDGGWKEALQDIRTECHSKHGKSATSLKFARAFMRGVVASMTSTAEAKRIAAKYGAAHGVQQKRGERFTTFVKRVIMAQWQEEGVGIEELRSIVAGVAHSNSWSLETARSKVMQL